MSETRIFIGYLIAINITVFFIFGIDKLLARRRWQRIPEGMLMALAVIGGSIGAWMGMYLFSHKTRHLKFRFGVPLILMAQVAVFFLCSCKSQRLVNLPSQNIISERPGEYSPTTLLILYDAEIGKEPLMKAIKEYGATIIYDYHMMNGMAIRKPDDKTLEESIVFFRKVKGVLTVERDHIIRLTDPVKPRLEVR